MDRRPLLGYRPTPVQLTQYDQLRTSTFQHKTETEHTDSHGRGRNRLRNGPRSLGPRITGDKLGTLRRSQECPICKNGTRTENNSRRRQKLGFRAGGKRNRKKFSIDLQLLMTKTTNDPILLKTLVCLERQQHDLIPEEYLAHKKKLSNRFGLVFIEDKFIVPKSLRTTIISLLHKGHPAINMMSLAARHFWRPKMMEVIQQRCETCILCKMSGKTIKPNLPQTKKIASHR